MYGEPVEMAAAGVLHQIISANMFRILDPYVIAHDIGAVFTDGLTYLMYSDAKGLKESFIPDVSFIRKTNLPPEFDLSKPHPGAPDLAVEIMSPDDKAIAVEAKVRLYFDKGTEEVWVAYPTLGSQSLHQYRRGSTTARIYREPDEVVDTSVMFPGLEGLTVAAIFRLPAWALDT
jgi:Uma2 family endonuclease